MQCARRQTDVPKGLAPARVQRERARASAPPDERKRPRWTRGLFRVDVSGTRELFQARFVRDDDPAIRMLRDALALPVTEDLVDALARGSR